MYEEEEEIPETYKKFIKKIKYREIFINSGEELEHCFICSASEANGKIGSRLCLCNASKCEGHVCNCTKENGICFDCLTKHLWECSKSMRIFNRFRAKCPFCKAEFCNLDLVKIRKR